MVDQIKEWIPASTMMLTTYILLAVVFNDECKRMIFPVAVDANLYQLVSRHEFHGESSNQRLTNLLQWCDHFFFLIRWNKSVYVVIWLNFIKKVTELLPVEREVVQVLSSCALLIDFHCINDYYYLTFATNLLHINFFTVNYFPLNGKPFRF